MPGVDHLRDDRAHLGDGHGAGERQHDLAVGVARHGQHHLEGLAQRAAAEGGLAPSPRSRSAKDLTRSRSRLSSGTRPSWRPSWNSRWSVHGSDRTGRLAARARRTRAIIESDMRDVSAPRWTGRTWHYDERYLDPDPLQFARAHGDPADREVVGLVASALAYGNVAQIRRSIARRAGARWGRGRRGRCERFDAAAAARRLARLQAPLQRRARRRLPAAASSRQMRRTHGSIEAFFAPGHAADAPHVGAGARVLRRARAGPRPRRPVRRRPAARAGRRALLLPLARATAAPASGSTSSCAGWSGGRASTSASGARWSRGRS